jgi:CBS domain-containing protein
MQIKNLPEFKNKPKPLSCLPETSVLEAAKLMTEKNFGSIVIVDKANKVLGVMTERDIFRRVVAKERAPAKTKVSEVMSSELRLAHEEDDLNDWLRIMSNERFRRLPIVDEDGHLVSIMSQGDFVSYTWPQLVGQVTTFTKSTISKNSQQTLIIFAVIAYALISLIIVVMAISGPS